MVVSNATGQALVQELLVDGHELDDERLQVEYLLVAQVHLVLKLGCDAHHLRLELLVAHGQQLLKQTL